MIVGILKRDRCCLNCDHCIPIGEGDHWCDECLVMVLDEYEPTDDYYSCNGKEWEER